MLTNQFRKKFLSFFLTIMVCATLFPMVTVSVGATTTSSSPLVNAAQMHIGKNRADLGLTDEWCAKFVSLSAVQAGLGDLFGVNQKHYWASVRQVAEHFVKTKNGTIYYYQETFSPKSNVVVSALKDTLNNTLVDSCTIPIERNLSSFTPQPGDLIFFLWKSGVDAGHNFSHIGIVQRAGIDPYTNLETVWFIDGNGGDKDANGQILTPATRVVRLKEYALSRLDIICYIRPNYCTHKSGFNTTTGACNNGCGAEAPLTPDTSCSGVYKKYSSDGVIPIYEKPYTSASSETQYCYRISVIGQVTNAAGEPWYKLSTGEYIPKSAFEGYKKESSLAYLNGAKTEYWVTAGRTMNLGYDKNYLTGTIYSDQIIKQIKAYVYCYTTGTHTYYGTVSVNKTSFSLNGTALDSSCKFSKLPVGSYRLMYDVTLSDGSTVTLSAPEHFFVIDPNATHAHTWDNGTVTTAPTKTQEGKKTFTCTGCGEVRTESIPMIAFAEVANADNQYWVTKEASMEVGDKYNFLTGKITANYNISKIQANVINMATNKSEYSFSVSNVNAKTYPLNMSDLDLGMKFSSLPVGNYQMQYVVTLSNSTTHTLNAPKTFAVINPTPPHSHTWDNGTVTTAPTYTQAGEKTFTCTGCGEIRTESVPMLELNKIACGQNLTCTYDRSSHTLTINGQGAMWDWEKEETPWHPFANAIQTVVIAPGITSIGNSAFYGCTALTDVSISDSVSTIGTLAFENCTALAKIDLPDRLNAIGASAFGYCSNLTDFVIPDGVTTVGAWAFYSCTSLDSVTIPTSVTLIDYGAFDGCSAIADVFYDGTQTEWNAITIGYYNDFLINANLHVKVIPHVHSYTSTVISPTCIDPGYTVHTCTGCGDSYQDSTTAPTGHNWNKFVCSDCGKKRTVYTDTSKDRVYVSTKPSKSCERITVTMYDDNGRIINMKSFPGSATEIQFSLSSSEQAKIVGIHFFNRAS